MAMQGRYSARQTAPEEDRAPICAQQQRLKSSKISRRRSRRTQNNMLILLPLCLWDLWNARCAVKADSFAFT